MLHCLSSDGNQVDSPYAAPAKARQERIHRKAMARSCGLCVSETLYTSRERRDWTGREGACPQRRWEFGQVELTERFPPEEAETPHVTSAERDSTTFTESGGRTFSVLTPKIRNLLVCIRKDDRSQIRFIYNDQTV